MSPELPSSDQAPTGGARRYPDLPSELMERVAGGDVDAFAELYDAMAARIYGLIDACCGTPPSPKRSPRK